MAIPMKAYLKESIKILVPVETPISSLIPVKVVEIIIMNNPNKKNKTESL